MVAAFAAALILATPGASGAPPRIYAVIAHGNYNAATARLVKAGRQLEAARLWIAVGQDKKALAILKRLDTPPAQLTLARTLVRMGRIGAMAVYERLTKGTGPEAAAAQLAIADRTAARFYSFRMSKKYSADSIKRYLSKATLALKEADAAYAGVIKTGDRSAGICASVGYAKVYAVFADTLEAAPGPPGLGPAAEQQYRGLMADHVGAIRAKAIAGARHAQQQAALLHGGSACALEAAALSRDLVPAEDSEHGLKPTLLAELKGPAWLPTAKTPRPLAAFLIRGLLAEVPGVVAAQNNLGVYLFDAAPGDAAVAFAAAAKGGMSRRISTWRLSIC